MLKKLFRFHGHNSLNFVHSKGKSVRVNALQLKYQKNQRRQENRVAVIVSKKVTKKSPVRNRIRRRIFEAMRLQMPLLDTPYDLVVSVFDERVASMPAAELNRSVVELLHKADLYKR